MFAAIGFIFKLAKQH